jgi:hypothetical protein
MRMKLGKRPIATAFLIFAFLYGAWGNIVAAAFCPRFSDRSCCPKHSQHSTSPVEHQHQQTEVSPSDQSDEMDGCAESHPADSVSSDERETENLLEKPEDSEPFLINPPEEHLCLHCLTHSQPGPGRFSITSDESRRGAEAAPAALIKPPLQLPSFAKTFTSYDHGPPGQSQSLFVLNSVFRI